MLALEVQQQSKRSQNKEAQNPPQLNLETVSNLHSHSRPTRHSRLAKETILDLNPQRSNPPPVAVNLLTLLILFRQPINNPAMRVDPKLRASRPTEENPNLHKLPIPILPEMQINPYTPPQQHNEPLLHCLSAGEGVLVGHGNSM